MNQFLIDGITYRAVYNDKANRCGCYLVDGGEFVDCYDCGHRMACPADGEDDE